jgi:hypothetical protein|tara:strand:- start:636 stop:998 length:363 start_codon:yes stop_codon:yes gene_type:complete
MKVTTATIKKLYKLAILEYQGGGCGVKAPDYLEAAVKKDVHTTVKAPGQWVGTGGVLEIYCESGIMNASDILDTEYGAVYFSDMWTNMDAWVNLALQGMGSDRRVYHEPCNGAVVGVFWH